MAASVLFVNLHNNQSQPAVMYANYHLRIKKVKAIRKRLRIGNTWTELNLMLSMIKYLPANRKGNLVFFIESYTSIEYLPESCRRRPGLNWSVKNSIIWGHLLLRLSFCQQILKRNLVLIVVILATSEFLPESHKRRPGLNCGIIQSAN